MAENVNVILIIYLSWCCTALARVIAPDGESLTMDSFRRRFITDPPIFEPRPFPPDSPWPPRDPPIGPWLPPPRDPPKPPPKDQRLEIQIPIDQPNGTPISQRSKLDLAFIMDTTGSMSPYINNVRQHVKELVNAIVASSSTDLRLALIEYRDHRPQEFTFVTRKHDFTSSVSTMKSWLNAAAANGGGDEPEAVAEAMYDATTLSWRTDSAKISILISDAPPHGLLPHDSFPNGSPNGHDPIKLARKMAKMGITLYSVGCEPSITPYKDFFMALAYLTGGQYIPLSVPQYLTDAIIGGAKEELSLQQFSADVKQEIQRVKSSGGTLDRLAVAKSVHNRLQAKGAKATQLLRNDKPLEGASEAAKALAKLPSMSEVRKTFKKGASSSSSGRSLSVSPIGGKRFLDFERAGISHMADIGPLGRLDSPASRMESPSMVPRRTSSSFGGGSGGAGLSSAADESFKAVKSLVSLDQIERLVTQEAAKMAL